MATDLKLDRRHDDPCAAEFLAWVWMHRIVQTYICGSNKFPSEFAVADASADFHLWPNYCSCPYDLAAIVHGDAVTAAQCRVGSEHAQNSFDATETVSCGFNQARRAGD